MCSQTNRQYWRNVLDTSALNFLRDFLKPDRFDQKIPFFVTQFWAKNIPTFSPYIIRSVLNLREKNLCHHLITIHKRN